MKTLSPFSPGKSGQRRGARNDEASANAMKIAGDDRESDHVSRAEPGEHGRYSIRSG